MSNDKNSKIRNDYPSAPNPRVIISTKNIGYFKKLFGKAKSTSKYSIILEKNGSISSVERERSISYLNFREKLLSIFGAYKVSEITVDHTPFNISYEFNKNDKYPLLSKDNQKISSFFSMELRILPSNPTIIFQSFPDKPNITVSDISLLLDQHIKSTTSASISEQNSQTVRSPEFQKTFLENLAPQFKQHTELIGGEIFSWTPPIFGTTQEEEEEIELRRLQFEIKLATHEKELERIKSENTEETNLEDTNSFSGINIGRDFNYSENNGISGVWISLIVAIIFIGIIAMMFLF